MNYEIKEMGLGGLLDYTFRLFKDNFVFVAAVMGIFVFPPSVIGGVATVAFTNSIAVPSEANAEVMAQTPPIGLLLPGILGVTIAIVTMLLSIFAQGAVCYAIAHRYLGTPVDLANAVGHAFGRLRGLLTASVLMMLGVTCGLILLILPGFYLIFVWYVAIPALMFEGLSGSSSLGRSRTLMNGEKGKAFVFCFLLGIINMAASGVIALVPEPYLASVLQSVMTCLVAGLNSVAVTVFYFSARCKAENFDLELLTQMLEPAGEDRAPVL